MGEDLVERYVRLTDTGLVPEDYRRWSFLVALAAILNRRVWTSVVPGVVLWPNLYVMLVGAPGVGKTQAIDRAKGLLETQPQVWLAPDSITHQAFVHDLATTPHRTDVDTLGTGVEATAALFLSEWGTFLEAPVPSTLSMLAHVFDGRRYEARVLKGNRHDVADKLYVNICAGATPAWFAEGFPPNSYEQGLPSRFIYVWSDVVTPPDAPDFDPGEHQGTDDPVVRELRPRLERVAGLQGYSPLTPGALRLLNDWKAEGYAPVPTEPMLAGYCARRFLFAVKLALLWAVARHPERLEVGPEDFRRGREVLLAAEPGMSEALAAAGGNVYQLRCNAIVNYVRKRHRQTGRPVREWEVLQVLGRMVPPYMLRTIVDTLLAQQALRALDGSRAPDRYLVPGARRKE